MRFPFSRYRTRALPFYGALCAMLAMIRPAEAVNVVENMLYDRAQACILRGPESVYWIPLFQGMTIEDVFPSLTREEKERMFIVSFGGPRPICRDAGLYGTMNYSGLSTPEELQEAAAMFMIRYPDLANHEFWE